MNIFQQDHLHLISDMLANDIDFILVGGYAVNFHGYNRTTGDLDVWLRPDNGNKERFVRLLEKLDLEQESIDHVHKLDFTRTVVFSIGEVPDKIDFLTKVSGVNYEEADQGKDMFEYEGLIIPFINLHHLVLTKSGTGRLKDKTDIEILQQIQKKK